MATKTTTSSTAPSLEAPTASAPAQAAVAPANVLSIVSLVTAIVSFAVGQPALAIAAIVLGFFGRNREPAAVTTANWGIVLGFVSLFGGFILAAVGISLFLPFAFGGAFWGF